MKTICLSRRVKLLFALLLLAAGILGWALIPSNKARREAERARRILRAQGFKLELSEFDFTSTSEQRQKANLLLQAGRRCGGLLPERELELARPLATNAALLLHTREKLRTPYSPNLWPALEEGLTERREILDSACRALLAPGQNRFEPATGSGGEFVIQYVGDLRALSAALSARTVLALHEKEHGAAFTNLLALTRLATTWRVEPLDSAHYLRFSFCGLAERTLWEALHDFSWSEDELLQLQREWETPDFFSGLPETAASTRAIILDQCIRESKQPRSPPVPLRRICSELFSDPSTAWNDLQAGVHESRYRKYGIFEDETQFMYYFRDRELELQKAITAQSWLEMRGKPGVTNVPSFTRAVSSTVGIRLNARRPGLGLNRQGLGLVRRACEVEALRRLAITSLALERYRLVHHEYPESLQGIVPQFVRTHPIDFMDGKPLRYQRGANGDFKLYSVGPDCVDDGGQMMRSESQNSGYTLSFGRREGPDIVWPRPASPEEAESYFQSRAFSRLSSR